MTQPTVLPQRNETKAEDGGKTVNITGVPVERKESAASDNEEEIPRLVEEKEKEEGWKAKLQGIYNYFKGVES